MERYSNTGSVILFVLLGLILIFTETASADTATKGIKRIKISDASGNKISLYQGSFALLIGVSDYANGWPDLTSIPDELKQLESILDKKGFNVDTCLDPDRKTLQNVFQNFIDTHGYDVENRLLIFYSGHGYTRKEKGYLVPKDAADPRKDLKGFLKKALPMNQVLAWSRQIEAKHVLFLFDSCFSGTIFKEKDLPDIPPQISRATALPVRQFLTAGSAGEPVPAKSVFTPAFIDALKYGWGDLNKDGYISGAEMGLYLQGTVPKHSRQTPQYGKIMDYDLSRGDFVFILAGGNPDDIDPGSSYNSVHNKPPVVEEPQPVYKTSGFTDPVTGMEFVWVPGGCYQMGQTQVEKQYLIGKVGKGDYDTYYADEHPRHEVCVDGFWMGKYEVTNRQYRKFKPSHSSKDYEDASLNGDDQPAVYVSWNDAKAFISWLNGKTGKTFSLPTEAQWEYACRAGTGTMRYWGDGEDEACAYANVHDLTSKRINKDFTWENFNCDDGYSATSPVGRFKPNNFGLHDMLGNVWEWCEDGYDGNAYSKHGQNNPLITNGSSRVLRGGSWYGSPRYVRCANRCRDAPSSAYDNYGFRLVLSGHK